MGNVHYMYCISRKIMVKKIRTHRFWKCTHTNIPVAKLLWRIVMHGVMWVQMNTVKQQENEGYDG